MEPVDQRVFSMEETTVEVDIIDVPPEVQALPDTPSEHVDTIIMDHFQYGLVYFKDCLHKFNSSSKNDMLKEYLSNYLKLFIRCTLDIADEIKRSPDTITGFDKELKLARLDPEIRRMWLLKVYHLLVKCIKKKGLHHVIVNLVCYFLGTLEFRNILFEKELNPDCSAAKIERESLLGLVVNSLDKDSQTDCAIVRKMLFPIIYSFNDNGQSFFCKWLCYVYNKNKLRCQAQSPPDNLSSDNFMMRCLSFVLYVWSESFRYEIDLNDFEEDDIVDPNAKMLVCCYKMVEISVIPMFSRIDYLKYRLREFQGIDTNIPFYNYLNNFRTSMTRKIQSLEKLLRDNPETSFKKPLEFYCCVAKMLKSQPLKTNISKDLLDSVCTFTILSYELHKNSFTQNQETLIPLSELSLDAFRHSNPLQINNPHSKLLAFRCFHLLTDLKVYCFDSIGIEKFNDIFVSLLNLYSIAHRLDGSLSGSSANLKKLIMTFFYQRGLPQKTSQLIVEEKHNETVEKFLMLAIADLNTLVEYLVEDEKYVRTSTSQNLESIHKEIQTNNSAAIGYLKVIRSIARFSVKSSNRNIFIPSLASSTSFICNQMTQLTGKNNENNNNVGLKFLRLGKELAYLMIDLSLNDVFLKHLMDKSVGFNRQYAEDLFEFTSLSLEGENRTQDFMIRIDKYVKSQQHQREVPSEFCDPLLCTPIDIPVVLPDTTVVMDKSVIERYLLEKQENPFSRKPLQIEEVYKFNQTEEAIKILEDYRQKRLIWENQPSEDSDDSDDSGNTSQDQELDQQKDTILQDTQAKPEV